MGFVSDKSKEKDHAWMQDDTKLQLKQPNLGFRFFCSVLLLPCAKEKIAVSSPLLQKQFTQK